jgi:hypothetical protein
MVLLYSACNTTPAPEAEKPRYQFTADKLGNTLRLDTVTGEVTRIKLEATRPKGPAKRRTVPQKSTVRSEERAATAVRSSEKPEESRSTGAAAEAAVATPVPSGSIIQLTRALAILSGGAGCGPDAHRAFAVLKNTDVFLKADPSSLRLATIGANVRVNGIAAEGEWRLVRFTDAIWGERAGYVRCSVLELARSTATDPSTPLADIAVRREPPTDSTVDPRQKEEILRGYLEWRKGNYIVVDGQRVRWTSATRLQLGRLALVSSVPVGYEMVVVGRRARDGSLVAKRIDATPNGIALYENEIVRGFDDVERAWLANGTMFLSNGKQLRDVGRIEDTGPAVDRARRIMNRIVPPYVDATRIRVHVVDSDEWNARAMANGAIWVNTGLLNDTSDDELAIVLGHELAHYTHEHSRRSGKNDTWRQLAAIGANAALSATTSRAAQETNATAGKLSLLAWGNGYSRTLEDQADRVGLRYAYEAGFDVERAIDLWSRARLRFGEHDVVTNWFVGDHSRPTDRIKNMRRELQLNYRSH